MTKLAQVIALVDNLTDDERQTVADLIRLKQSPGKSKAAAKGGKRSQQPKGANSVDTNQQPATASN